MRKVTLDDFRKACGRGYYARHVLLSGHVPGALSGSELASEARQWGWYHRKRAQVMDWAEENLGVTHDRDRSQRGWPRVWMRNGKPVRIEVENAGVLKVVPE